MTSGTLLSLVILHVSMVMSPCSKLRKNSRFEKLNYITSSQVGGGFVRTTEALRMTYRRRDEKLGDIFESGTKGKDDGQKVKIVHAEVDGEVTEHRICLKRPTNKTAGPYGDKAKLYRKA